MIEKPMLAGTCTDTSKLRYPVIVSPKLDGIRCISTASGKVVSRKLKDIPNRFIRETIQRLRAEKPQFIDLDGELLVGDSFQSCTSGVMSRDGEPEFTYYVFDGVSPTNSGPKEGCTSRSFESRLAEVVSYVRYIGDPRISAVPHRTVTNEEQLLAAEAEYLAQGYEGLMVRAIEGPYKFGRSTEKQGWLLKVKRFVDSEAEIIGFEELLHNANELQTDELGYAKRSSAKDGRVPTGTLGKFLVRDLQTGVEFAVGTGVGLTQALRREVWDDRDAYVGRIVKYRHQDHGVKDKPRLPIWLGFRDERDM